MNHFDYTQCRHFDLAQCRQKGSPRLRLGEAGIAHLVLILTTLLLLAGIGIAVYLTQFTQIFKPKAAENPSFSKQTSKQLMAVFYWYHPWYGLHYFDNNTEPIKAPDRISGNVSQQAFVSQLKNPIPYLPSVEHPTPLESPEYSKFPSQADVPTPQQEKELATAWYKANFERAAYAGITVLTPMVIAPADPPDMENRPPGYPTGFRKWPLALESMIDALQQLRNEGKP